VLKFLGLLKDLGAPIARGRGVVLRNFRRDDLRRLREWFKDPEMVRLSFGLEGDAPVLDQIARDYIKEIACRLTSAVAIEIPEGRHIGFIRWTAKGGDPRVARLGIMIGERRYWGNGLGTEAVRLFLHYLFEKKGVETVDLDTAEFNERALRCFEKCGFARRGATTEMNFLNGQVSHKVLLSLHRADFKDSGSVDLLR
jgi:RimJ/RimL family protein N-acetyltransferase